LRKTCALVYRRTQNIGDFYALNIRNIKSSKRLSYQSYPSRAPNGSINQDPQSNHQHISPTNPNKEYQPFIHHAAKKTRRPPNDIRPHHERPRWIRQGHQDGRAARQGHSLGGRRDEIHVHVVLGERDLCVDGVVAD
jgi:hypothetical protein